MTEREKVKLKINALLAKTVDRGATEEEALLAANKAAELMEHFDIQTTELDIKNTKSIAQKIFPQKYGRRNIGSAFAISLAKLFDCKVWGNGEGYVLFGFPEDTEVAKYLFDVLTNAVFLETKHYKNSKEFVLLKQQGYHGKTLVSSFINGIESRISERLSELSDEKRRNVQEQTGTALVLLKSKQVEDDFDDLGIRLRTTTRYTRNGSSSAYSQGRNRGNKVNINTGLNNKSSELIG